MSRLAVDSTPAVRPPQCAPAGLGATV